MATHSSRVASSSAATSFEARSLLPIQVSNRRGAGGVPAPAPGPTISLSLRRQGSLVAQAATVDTETDSYVSLEARYALFKNAEEHEDEVPAEVEGTIPSWINGSVVLNGGGVYQGMNHMFDGFAYLSKLHIENGEVLGSGKYVDSEAFRTWFTTGKMRWNELATRVQTSNIFEEIALAADAMGFNAKLTPSFTDNAGVNVVSLNDGTAIAMSETTTAQYRIDVQTLSTLSQVCPNDGLPGSLTTAHPKILPDGNLLNFTRDVPFGGFHVFIQDRDTLQRTEIAYIPDMKPGSPAWVHDMAVTDKHAIICETPAFINLASMLTGSDCDYLFFDWEPEMGSNIHVVPLDGSREVKTYRAPAFFTFHFANAYENAEGDIFMDMAMYDNPDIITDLLMEKIRAYPGQEVSWSGLRRMTIPKDGASVSISQCVEDESTYGNFAEFPAFNRAYQGKDYQYCYGLCATRPTNLGNSLAKWDVKGRTAKTWHQAGSLVGEPIFVSSPEATAEDDGVLLSCLMNADGKSSLLVIDAKTMTELGRANLPYAIPYRFHGTFIPN